MDGQQFPLARPRQLSKMNGIKYATCWLIWSVYHCILDRTSKNLETSQQTSCTAAALLTQLSGQLQQLNSSNLQQHQHQKQQQTSHPPPNVAATPSHQHQQHDFNDSSEFDLPAPPSPDMLDALWHLNRFLYPTSEHWIANDSAIVSSRYVCVCVCVTPKKESRHTHIHTRIIMHLFALAPNCTLPPWWTIVLLSWCK